MIESTEFGRSLPRRVASATASRICCRIQIWLAPTGALTSKVGMPVSWQMAPSPSTARSMFCAMIVSAWPDRVPSGSATSAAHRRAHVGRQIGRGPDDELKDAVEEGWEHSEEYNSASGREGLSGRASVTFRTERDPLGELQVPADAYYGVQTLRAVENFPISGLRAPADLVTATILIKKAAAEANAALGRLDAHAADAIMRAATRSWRARSAISSSSTSTRPAPAPRTT